MTAESLVRLRAKDGHELEGYQAPAAGERRAGLVLLQEIFGVTGHIRRVCDDYARHGYDVIAPALFDRNRSRVELPYDSDGTAEGKEIAVSLRWDGPMMDIAAAVAHLRADGCESVGVIGYCWGGSLAWLAAQRVAGVTAAVSYYGGQVAQFLSEKPACPVMLHFGREDAFIPMEDVTQIREAQSGMEVYLYPAGHGFNCDERGAFHQASADLALERSLAFLTVNLG